MPLHTPREHTHGHEARTRPNGRARAAAQAPPTAPTLLTACRTSRIPSHPTVAQCAGWCAASATPTRKRAHHSSKRSRAQREECATAVPRRARHLPRARRCAGAVVGRGRGSHRRKSSARSNLAGSRRATPNPTPPPPPPQPRRRRARCRLARPPASSDRLIRSRPARPCACAHASVVACQGARDGLGMCDRVRVIAVTGRARI